MIKIKLNNEEFEISAFTKTTTFYNQEMVSTANCTLPTLDMAVISELAQTPITSLQIYNNDNKIYELDNINAVITNIVEMLEDTYINITMNIAFTNI